MPHLKSIKPVNTKHLYDICTMLDQRRGRWADVVQMFDKGFVFAGKGSTNISERIRDVPIGSKPPPHYTV